MEDEGLEQRWGPGLAEVAGSMAQWRRKHPQATLTEIEDALDERMGAMRAEMLADAALASGSARFAGKQANERPKCPECGQVLISRGIAERLLTTAGGRDIRLRRSYAHCPGCGLEFFPPR